MKRVVLMLAVLVAAATAYVGCKQGEGERCQVNEDCESGACNQAEGLCSTTGGQTMDDAEVPDGPPPDAAPDAMPDAP